MTHRSTQVSKTNATIKRILAATVGGGFKGTKVTVDEVDRFDYQLYPEMGTPTIAYVASANGSAAHETQRATIHRNVTLTSDLFHEYGGACVVIYHRYGGGKGSVTIYIPTLDQGVLEIARDAVLAGEKRKASDTLAQFVTYGGIASAIVEAQVKSLAKGSSEPVAPRAVHGRLTPREKAAQTRATRSAERLESEIEDILGRRVF
jgi:hypothetical protein